MSDEPPARKRPSGLGRGLSSLLGEVAQEAPVAGGVAPARGGIQMMPVSSIEPHLDQPRRHFDEEALDELAASIQARGPDPADRRPPPRPPLPDRRRRAALAGGAAGAAARNPGHRPRFNDAETLEVALLENIQRQDLNAIEEAEGYSG